MDLDLSIGEVMGLNDRVTGVRGESMLDNAFNRDNRMLFELEAKISCGGS